MPSHQVSAGARRPLIQTLALPAALCLGLCVYTGGTLAAEGLATYYNQRFEYTVHYPAELLVPQGEADNRDGQVFKAKRGEATLTVYGQYLMEDIPSQCDAIAQAKTMGGSEIIYQVAKANLSVASGYQNASHIFYLKKIKRNGKCLSLALIYPVADRRIFDTQAGKISMD